MGNIDTAAVLAEGLLVRVGELEEHLDALEEKLDELLDLVRSDGLGRVTNDTGWSDPYEGYVRSQRAAGF